MSISNGINLHRKNYCFNIQTDIQGGVEVPKLPDEDRLVRNKQRTSLKIAAVALMADRSVDEILREVAAGRITLIPGQTDRVYRASVNEFLNRVQRQHGA
jgi:hypothetical protein